MMTGKDCENSTSVQKRNERNFNEEETNSVSKKLKTGLRDSISLLPEDVLGNILSRLPTKLAASTSVLSKRWRTLFALVHNLDFDDSVFVNPEQSDDNTLKCFKNFVDRTLALQGGSSIQKFSLKFQNYDDSELDCVSRWITNVVGRGVLELSILHVCFEGASRCICSQTIKKLKVYYANEHMPRKAKLSMSFDAPNLVSLDYTDLVKTDYPKVNLQSLVEAKLDLTYSKQIHNPDLAKLIVGISNVQTLHLSHFTVNAISSCCWRGFRLPVFKNLVNLSFLSWNKKGWKLFPHLLKQTPNLETLTVQCIDSCNGDVNLRPSQVKVLHVLGYGNFAGEMDDLISFVCGTKSLELVEVEIRKGVVMNDDLKIFLEVALPNCSIKLQI